ncbi:protein YABBY 7-like [Ananas comosus]|uniref:Protein YABBY 7-like n=1 Tax=Ananas comosus TaxID=4615 RepID=A0A6P5FTC5_ANACO|nr:protein YABBY 7-like [Ananas comosus]
MSICNPQFELPEQLGYVQCSFCATVLLVSVPCNSQLLQMVTVRCGHCTGLLSVSLTAAAGTSFLPPLEQVLASLPDDLKEELCGDADCGAWNDVGNEGERWREDEEKEKESINPTPSAPVLVNKPPEKRQRAPSAYNRFIKEEIQRIKTKDPTITHKAAFSTAAKNWAHFPRIPAKGDGESCSVSGEEKD